MNCKITSRNIYLWIIYLVRARKKVMTDSMEWDIKSKNEKKIKAMISDTTGKLKMKVITEEHESVAEDPSGRYLFQFVP